MAQAVKLTELPAVPGVTGGGSARQCALAVVWARVQRLAERPLTAQRRLWSAEMTGLTDQAESVDLKAVLDGTGNARKCGLVRGWMDR